MKSFEAPSVAVEIEGTAFDMNGMHIIGQERYARPSFDHELLGDHRSATTGNLAITNISFLTFEPHDHGPSRVIVWRSVGTISACIQIQGKAMVGVLRESIKNALGLIAGSRGRKGVTPKKF